MIPGRAATWQGGGCAYALLRGGGFGHTASFVGHTAKLLGLTACFWRHGCREMLCVLLQSGVVDVNVGLNDVGFVVDVVVLIAVRLAIAIDHGVVCLHVSVVLVLVIVDLALGVAAVIFLSFLL